MDEDGIYDEPARPCMICKKPCTRVDLSFEGPLHYHICRTKMWNDYAQTFRDRPLDEPTF